MCLILNVISTGCQFKCSTYLIAYPREAFAATVFILNLRNLRDSHEVTDCSQLFQRSILIMDIATYRLNQHRDLCSENYLKCITRWEGRGGVTITIFPAYKEWTQYQLSIRRHPHKDLKWTKLCLGPIQTRLKAFLGFLAKM